jgi:hypothetical protein
MRPPGVSGKVARLSCSTLGRFLFTRYHSSLRLRLIIAARLDAPG